MGSAHGCELRPLWHGPQLDRLLDERHAVLAAAWKHRLESWGWEVRVEVSYSRFGERGRIDLFGWYAPLHALLVTEIKTDMVDAQGLFGPLDAKARLARAIAVDLGWRDASIVMPMLLFSDDSTVRRRVARLGGTVRAVRPSGPRRGELAALAVAGRGAAHPAAARLADLLRPGICR